MAQQFNRAIGIVHAARRYEDDLQTDAEECGAPRRLLAKGKARRMAQARHDAERVAHMPLRAVFRLAHVEAPAVRAEG